MAKRKTGQDKTAVPSELEQVLVPVATKYAQGSNTAKIAKLLHGIITEPITDYQILSIRNMQKELLAVSETDKACFEEVVRCLTIILMTPEVRNFHKHVMFALESLEKNFATVRHQIFKEQVHVLCESLLEPTSNEASFDRLSRKLRGIDILLGEAYYAQDLMEQAEWLFTCLSNLMQKHVNDATSDTSGLIQGSLSVATIVVEVYVSLLQQFASKVEHAIQHERPIDSSVLHKSLQAAVDCSIQILNISSFGKNAKRVAALVLFILLKHRLPKLDEKVSFMYKAFVHPDSSAVILPVVSDYESTLINCDANRLATHVAKWKMDCTASVSVYTAVLNTFSSELYTTSCTIDNKQYVAHDLFTHKVFTIF